MVVQKIVQSVAKKKMMNNPVAYSEMKLKVLITEIEKRLDKNQKDYWVIRTKLDEFVVKTFLAFSDDYKLSDLIRSLLTNCPYQLVNKMAVLTIKKKDDFEKVIAMELEK